MNVLSATTETLERLVPAHFTANPLINPTNPITVNLIGAGGTGSQVLTALSRINYALVELGHAGLQVWVWDADVVSTANLGRQLFATAEVGLPKATALIHRVNRFFGTNWKAMPIRYDSANLHRVSTGGAANLTITCVDTVATRIEVGTLLKRLTEQNKQDVNRPYYWLDFGNGPQAGQVILSTVGAIPQPASHRFQPVAVLPMVTDEYGGILSQSEQEDTGPSCSLAEALQRQDLFINATLADMGCSLLWNLFRSGLTTNRGFFLNLGDFRSQPLKVE